MVRAFVRLVPPCAAARGPHAVNGRASFDTAALLPYSIRMKKVILTLRFLQGMTDLFHEPGRCTHCGRIHLLNDAGVCLFCFRELAQKRAA